MLFATAHAFANSIDQLKNPEQVWQFITRVAPNEAFSRASKDSGRSPVFQYRKLDLNGDGHTDLLVEDEYLFAIIDKGHNTYFIRQVGNVHFKCKLIRVDTLAATTVFIIQRSDAFDRNAQKYHSVPPDTLVYHFDAFIEFNPHPENAGFQMIRFKTNPCMGVCPVFDLSLKSDGHALIDAQKNCKVTGLFTAMIDQKILSEIEELVNYLPLGSIKNNYDDGWQKDRRADLELVYGDTIKKVTDYGMEGSFGLRQLYSLLARLVDEANWKK